MRKLLFTSLILLSLKLNLLSQFDRKTPDIVIKSGSEIENEYISNNQFNPPSPADWYPVALHLSQSEPPSSWVVHLEVLIIYLQFTKSGIAQPD